MKRPLIERKSILESVLQDVPNRFEKLKYKQVKGSKAVFDIFNVAVERGDEGLIIK